ncbi:hypothetical protein TNCV_4753431 [Trichonephila clavipes]|nr:hypothetical protein TNCV_4753431 [Trichonephila clavipes]
MNLLMRLLVKLRNEINSSSEMRKTVKINGYYCDALIDTGSTITLIRESVYQILGRPALNATKIKLTSLGFAHNILDFLSLWSETVKLKALLQAPLAFPQRGEMSPTGKEREGGNIRT